MGKFDCILQQPFHSLSACTLCSSRLERVHSHLLNMKTHDDSRQKTTTGTPPHANLARMHTFNMREGSHKPAQCYSQHTAAPKRVPSCTTTLPHILHYLFATTAPPQDLLLLTNCYCSALLGSGWPSGTNFNAAALMQ